MKDKNTNCAWLILRRAILCAVAIYAFTSVIIAQVPALRNTDKNPDQSLKSSARVNPSTLAMEMSIPLGSYSGRAGNSIANTFTYSSKVWQIKNYGSFVYPSGREGITVVPFFARRSAAGWNSSLGVPRIDYGDEQQYYLETGGDYEGVQWVNVEYGGNYDIFYLKRLHVVLPDGSTHEFRSSDTPIQCGTTNVPSCEPDLTGTFLSVDGSKMRLEVATNDATLFMPDGGRILFGAVTSGLQSRLATAMIDQHGNKTTFSSSNNQWTDTVGRVFPNPLPANYAYVQEQTVGNQTVSLPGISDTIDTVLSWRYLKDPNGGEGGLGDPNQELAYPSDLYCDGSRVWEIEGAHLFTNEWSSDGIRICNYGASEPGPAFNPVVLTKIELANGQSYQFKYNLYGEIEKVIYPSGGYERFVYGQIPPIQNVLGPWNQTNRGVTDRWVSAKGDGSDELHWTYGVTRGTWQSPAPYIVTMTNPDGTRTEQFLNDEPDFEVQRPYGFDNAKSGRSYEDRVYSSGSPGQLLRRKLTEYTSTGALSGGYSFATRDTRPVKEVSIVFESGDSNALASMTETIYDTSGNSDPAYFSALNPKQQKTYHYVVVNASTAASANITTAAGWFSSATPAVINEMDYLYDSSYKARNINGLVTETRVADANGNSKAKTQITYDGVSLLNDATSTRWENPNTNYRGLVTKTRTWHDISNNLYIDTQAQYDLMGNLRYSWDGRNNLSQTEYSSTYDYAYSTKTISPIPGGNGSTTAFTATTVYDYNTGLPTSNTDANGQTTTMDYVDPATGEQDALLRIRAVTAPNGHQTISDYGAGSSESTRWVKSKSQIDASSWKEAVTWFDGLGRTIRTQSVDDDGDVFALTCYDEMGRVSKVTNPFRGFTNQTCPTTTGLEWTTNTFDTAGRPWKVTTPDGAVVETTYGLATTGSQIGTVVTVEDQADKQRRSITNALGQLIRVDEPSLSGSNPLGNINTPNQPTIYGYDLLNNLTSVLQEGDTTEECRGTPPCSQSRSFTYDALSRLKSAVNPELGTINYGYDSNGNLTSKTDARGIITNYAYDAINRVTQRGYATPNPTPNPATYQTTPTVTYYYDNTSVSNSKGKLTKVTSSVSTTEYTSFDILGRVTGHKQTTDGTQYTTGYTYNLSGALIEETYPSGRVVKNVLDNNGDLELVQSKKNSASGYWNYANSFSYNAAGAVTLMQLGNGKWESTVFNSRLQPTQIALGTVQNGTDKLDLDYTYGTTVNNGNVLTQTITVPGLTHSFVQSYTYDSLNRLDDANETFNGGQTWQQDFTFDRYGNRNFNQTNTTMPASFANPAVTNPTISTSNNRITSSGWTYDAAGNTLTDANGQSYIYDGENKQVKASNGGGTLGEYLYDGDGKRVKKYVPSSGEVTIFVYDAAGKQIAEYSTIVYTDNDAKVAYVTNDHLGSPRINTDREGNVTSRHDYLPFGEELTAAITSQRSTTVYPDDTIRKQFTGYERDSESGLDFAQARYFGSAHGRFTSPDPLAASANSIRPQSWNRYSYSYNNPLRYTDPSGMVAGDFYDENANYLGTDQINDGKIFVVTEDKDKKLIKANEKAGNPTSTGAIQSEVFIPSEYVRKEIQAAVDRSNSPTADDPKGKFHEEGGIWGKNDKGEDYFVRAVAGAVSNPLVDTHASINLRAFENNADAGKLQTLDGAVHIHPAGTKTEGNKTGSFIPEPSSQDFKAARARTTDYNIVVGAGNDKVYIYNQTKVVLKMSLKNFMKVGVR